MPNSYLSRSCGAGFTFHHHEGGQIQSYEFTAVGSNDNDIATTRATILTSVKISHHYHHHHQMKGKGKDHPFDEDVMFYAETFIETTKGKPSGEARVCRNVLRKEVKMNGDIRREL